MEVMKHHDFFDSEVEKVEALTNTEVRRVILKEKFSQLYLSKEDIISFAKEFDLVVYEKGSNL